MRKSIKCFLITVLCLSLLFVSAFQITAPVPAQAATFAYGADVGWLQQMEAQGRKFYDDNGVEKDCLQILKEHGINSIRFRVWVNPSMSDPYNGHCSKDEVVSMAVRAKNMGFRIMIDFHYSDSWADPGKQNKPAAWASHSLSQLLTDVDTHTRDVLNALKTAGVTPEWVQVGNETNNGMLWDTGKASVSMSNYAQLTAKGYDAVKAIFPSAKVIVHISNGYDNSLFRWIFDGLNANGGKYDVIGMSLYPTTSDWSTKDSQTLTNMNDMVSRYGKEVMMCEVGLDYTAATTCKSFLADIINKTKSVSGGKGTGVFYWEPQCYNWNSYNKGAWNTNGRPTVAMDAFLEASGTTPGPTATPTPTPTTGPTPTHGGSNLAQGKTASADSVQSANPAANGNDGSTSTRWCAADGNTGHWWKVDLGSNRNITSTEVMWEFARNYKYKIEVSTDNTNWTLAVDKTSTTSTAQTVTDNFTANARYVRITVTGLTTSPATWASFFEFRVFGS